MDVVRGTVCDDARWTILTRVRVYIAKVYSLSVGSIKVHLSQVSWLRYVSLPLIDMFETREAL